MNKITFDEPGTFVANYAAERWLRDRGFSIGSSQCDQPRAIWFGDCYISKWRGLNAAERRDMHAVMTGDGRNGPVHIELCAGATSEAIKAFNAGNPP